MKYIPVREAQLDSGFGRTGGKTVGQPSLHLVLGLAPVVPHHVGVLVLRASGHVVDVVFGDRVPVGTVVVEVPGRDVPVLGGLAEKDVRPLPVTRPKGLLSGASVKVAADDGALWKQFQGDVLGCQRLLAGKGVLARGPFFSHVLGQQSPPVGVLSPPFLRL